MIAEELKQLIAGDVLNDEQTLTHYSRDASLFEVRPTCVIFPKHSDDIQKLVHFVAEKKASGENISLTARAAGTDMTGGPLSESIVLDCTKHMHHVREVGTLLNVSGAESEGYAITEPGVFYRDFEKATLAKGFLMPSYPASREICAIGGMVGNNAGGEKTLRYGKVKDFVLEIKMVCADGNEYVFKPINEATLKEKEALTTFEGKLYRDIRSLVESNHEVINASKPTVSKSSAGYNLWEVWDGTTFDMTKLIVGSQGTLGIITEVTLRLVKPKSHRGLLVLFMKDLKNLGEVIQAVLPFQPMSFESFDDHTFRLAIKYLWGFVKLLARNPFSLAFAFLPEFLFILTRGMPKLVLMVEFAEDNETLVKEKITSLQKAISQFSLPTRVAMKPGDINKYFAIRRESFNLLRQKVKGMQTAPFIDDLIVPPETLQTFLPKLYEILDRYKLLYTIAGHVGDGNFHIIPLMRLGDEEERKKIRPVLDEVSQLTLSAGGSLTAEHNDGLIRGPYLEKMFGRKMFEIFAQTKTIFDPSRIFNSNKKTDSTFDYAFSHIKQS